MAIRLIQLRFCDGDRSLRRLVLSRDQGTGDEAGISLSTRTQPLEGGTMVRATISNRSGVTVRLDSLRFDLDTGFSAASPARFFKHGYQSWSASRVVDVGTAVSSRARPLLARLAHQSEAQRPEEAPEHATSELFTIIQSASASECFLAGFIGDSHLATVTVPAPDRVFARALLDDVTLCPGETREVEPMVFWQSGESPARNAARWAGMLGQAAHARCHAPYQRGWCSWYHYFHAITEEALLSNLRMLQDLRAEYPIEVFQLDDGYQEALGDWDRANIEFPSGLRKIADKIRAAGFTAGLWTAPFLATRDSRVMRDHPAWFIRESSGQPLRCAYNTNWTKDADKFAYALDPSNPQVGSHLEHLFETIVQSYGYNYLKLDFLFAGAAEGIREDTTLTRAQALRRGLMAIRRGAGETAFILGCGSPIGPGVGIFDGMRIGPDVAPYWGSEEKGEPGTVLAIDAILARSFMHRRLWLNDPDCLMLRAKDTDLSSEERLALASSIAASGGMLLVSDDMSALDDESAALFRMVAGIGAAVDAAAISEPPIATTLMQASALRVLSIRMPDGALHLLLNMSDKTQDVSLPGVLGLYGNASIIGVECELEAQESIAIPPHGARLVRTSLAGI